MSLPESILSRPGLDDWWLGLVELYQAEAAACDEAIDAAAHLSECGRILREELARLDEARSVYERAWQMHPEGTQIPRALLSLAQQRSDWREAAKWLDVLTQEAETKALATSYILELARIKAVHLGERRTAVALCGSVLDDEPSHPDALALFDQLCRHDPKSELDVLKRRIAASQNTAELERLLARVGYLLELEEPASAEEAYRQVLRMNAAHRGARLGVYRIIGRRGDLVEMKRFLSEVIPLDLDGDDTGLNHVRADLLQVADDGSVPSFDNDYAYLFGFGALRAGSSSVESEIRAHNPVWLGAAYAAGIQAEKEGNPSAALQFYRSTEPVSSLYMGPLLATRRLMLTAGSPDEFVATTEALREKAMTASYKAWLATHLGLTCLHRFGRPRQALEQFEHALGVQLSAVRSSGAVGAAGLEPFIHLIIKEVDTPKAIHTLKGLVEEFTVEAVPWMLYDTIAELYESGLESEEAAARYYNLSLGKNSRKSACSSLSTDPVVETQG